MKNKKNPWNAKGMLKKMLKKIRQFGPSWYQVSATLPETSVRFMVPNRHEVSGPSFGHFLQNFGPIPGNSMELMSRSYSRICHKYRSQSCSFSTVTLCTPS